MAAFKDYYKTLGVSETASADEIKAAFRKMARHYHPDVAEDKVAGEAKFKEANEAYEVLGDPEKRKKYDQLREQGSAPASNTGAQYPPGFDPGQGAGESHFEGTGFSDFFEQFFGRSQGFGHAPFTEETETPRGQRQRHGHDIEGAILVTLDEVMHGSVREISLQKSDPATGSVQTESFKVRIPKGVLEGQVIRIHSKGQPGRGGGEAGHLFLHVRLASHPDFQVLGADLYYPLPLTPWEAVLGTTVTIRSLDGDLQVRIPPSAVNGQKLRVRGKGLPKPKSEARGDLYVIAEIQMPTDVSPEERKLWEKLGQMSSFNPRA